MGVTHPFHPLFLQQLELVDDRGAGVRRRALVRLDDGRVSALPVHWTDLVPVELHVALAQGRSCLRVQDLLRLAEMLEELRR